MIGGTWSLAFALRVHDQDFSTKMRRSAQSLGKFSRAQQQVKENLEEQKASLYRSAAAAAGYSAALVGLWRGLQRITRAAQDFQFNAAGLATVLKTDTLQAKQMYLQFQKLNPQVKEFAPAEVIGRMKQLAQAGYNTNEVLTSMGAVLDSVVASMGTISTDQAVELGVNLHRAFGGAGKSMRSVLDTAVATTKQFPLTLDQVAVGMGYATQAAIQMQQPLDETLITLGALVPVTKTASKAGTAFRNAVQGLLKPKSIEFFKKWNVQVKDHEGNIRRLLDIYGDLFDRLKEIERTDPTKVQMKREQMEKEIGGIRGAAIFAAYRRLTENITGAAGTMFAGEKFKSPEAALLALRSGIGGAVGETKNFAERMRETAELVQQKFTAAAEKAETAIGTYLLPLKNRMLEMFTSIFDKISETLGVTEEPATGGPLGDILSTGLMGLGGGLAAMIAGETFTMARGLRSALRGQVEERAIQQATPPAPVGGAGVRRGPAPFQPSMRLRNVTRTYGQSMMMGGAAWAGGGFAPVRHGAQVTSRPPPAWTQQQRSIHAQQTGFASGLEEILPLLGRFGPAIAGVTAAAINFKVAMDKRLKEAYPEPKEKAERMEKKIGAIPHAMTMVEKLWDKEKLEWSNVGAMIEAKSKDFFARLVAGLGKGKLPEEVISSIYDEEEARLRARLPKKEAEKQIEGIKEMEEKVRKQAKMFTYKNLEGLVATTGRSKEEVIQSLRLATQDPSERVKLPAGAERGGLWEQTIKEIEEIRDRPMMGGGFGGEKWTILKTVAAGFRSQAETVGAKVPEKGILRMSMEDLRQMRAAASPDRRMLDIGLGDVEGTHKLLNTQAELTKELLGTIRPGVEDLKKFMERNPSLPAETGGVE